MRGKGSSAEHTACGYWIIPAHAGKSTSDVVVLSARRDHPRSCGEKALGSRSTQSLAGSSPLMRGKGRTWFALHTQAQDHPRSCGEKRERTAQQVCNRGSSPLMRGKEICREHRQTALRIIPAHAGKRSVKVICNLYERDHPRSCGEK